MLLDKKALVAKSGMWYNITKDSIKSQQLL